MAALEGADATEAPAIIRSLIERVVLHPAPDGQRGFEIELVGEITAMVNLGRDEGGHTAADRRLIMICCKVQ